MSNGSEKNLIRSVGRGMLCVMEMEQSVSAVLQHRCLILPTIHYMPSAFQVLPGIMRIIKDFLHLDALTVTGKTVGDNLDDLENEGIKMKCFDDP